MRKHRWAVSAILTACLLLAIAPAAVADAVAPPSRQLFTFAHPTLEESSGLALNPAGTTVFTMQDAGMPIEVLAFDTNGKQLATIVPPGVANNDWEDIARGTTEAGKPALYIGDTGDTGDAYPTTVAKGKPARTEFAVIRLDLPELTPGATPATITATGITQWRLRYPDGTTHNCESLAVQPGSNRMYLVEKMDLGPDKPAPGPAVVWAMPENPSTTQPNTLIRVAELPLSKASAADFSPDGRMFATRDGAHAYLWQVNGGDVAAALATPPTVIALPKQQQGESLTFAADGRRLWVGSEGKNSAVWAVDVPTAATPLAQRSEPHRSLTKVLALAGVAGLGLLVLAIAGWRARRRNSESTVE